MPIVKFAGTLNGNYKLLELSDETLRRAVNEGGALCIKGGHDDEAVLCTDDATFRIRAVHTSNLHMLLREDTIEAMTTNTLEASRMPPALERLHEWLAECPYEGPDNDGEEGRLERLHCERLFREIQASDVEIQRALTECGASRLNGHYRVIGAEYTQRFFRCLWSVLVLNDWRADGMPIPRAELMEQLTQDDEFPAAVAEKLLEIYSISGDGVEVVRLDGPKICRFFGGVILKRRGSMPLSKLMQEWAQLTGDFQPHPSMLIGTALMTPVPGSDDFEVDYFPHQRLPIDPLARFTRLFEERSRWRLLELEAYVEGSARAAGVSTMNLIVKYGRISGEGEGRIVTPLLPVTPKPTLLR